MARSRLCNERDLISASMVSRWSGMDVGARRWQIWCGLDADRSGFGAGDQVVSDRQDQPVACRTRAYASLLLGDDVNGRNQRDYCRIAPVVAGERGGYVCREEPVCVQVELSGR